MLHAYCLTIYWLNQPINFYSDIGRFIFIVILVVLCKLQVHIMQFCLLLDLTIYKMFYFKKSLLVLTFCKQFTSCIMYNH